MSTGAGEKGQNDWPTATNQFLADISPFQPLSELADGDISPRGYTHIANNYRDNYIKTGSRDSHGWAFYYYENALAIAGGDQLLEAWIFCHRLNLYLFDLQTGRVPLTDVLEELDFAWQIAHSTKAFQPKRRQFRRGTLEWIEEITENLYRSQTDRNVTGEYERPELKLVGGTALEGSSLADPRLEPGAA